MKTSYKYLLIIALLFMNLWMYSQNDAISDVDSTCQLSIQNNTMQSILERVLPNVQYEYAFNFHMLPIGNYFLMKYHNHIFNLDLINELLLQLKYLEDSSYTIADEELIQAYIYLKIAAEQPTCKFDFPVSFKIDRINTRFQGDIGEYYKRIGVNNLNLNYHVEAIWKSNNIFSVQNNWIFDFNISEGEIISLVRTNNESRAKNKSHFDFLKFSKEMEKLEPYARDNYINDLKKESRRIRK